MTKINWKGIREWINTFVAILTLIVLIIATIVGYNISINLKEATIDKVTTSEVRILYPNGSLSGCFYSNSTGKIIGPCPNPDK